MFNTSVETALNQNVIIIVKFVELDAIEMAV
jgi:hypothetical protein